jgi:hypothetical protein
MSTPDERQGITSTSGRHYFTWLDKNANVHKIETIEYSDGRFLCRKFINDLEEILHSPNIIKVKSDQHNLNKIPRVATE